MPYNSQITCQICGKLFTPKNNKVCYCSKDCQKKAMYQKNLERRRLASIEKYKNNPDAKTCLICGLKAMDLTPHITLGHKITVKEYCKRFQCQPEDLISKQANANRSKGQKESTNPNKKRFSSENNPAKGHGGKYSPFSKNFIKYAGLSDEEKQAQINKVIANTDHIITNRSTNIAYYTSRGMNEQQAREALHARQQTFTKEKCIEKYGEEEGLKRYRERQLKWEKNFPKNNYSKISQELFKILDSKLDASKYTTFYATKGIKFNNEYTIQLEDSFCKADFYISEIKLIIEFDGDYWHGEARGNQERDRIRDEKLLKLGYKLLRIKERDYKSNPEKTIAICIAYIDFLTTQI